MSSADGRPRRRGPIALALAWLAVLAGGAAVAAYALATGPDSRPVDDRPPLSMSLPDPPAPQQAEAPLGDDASADGSGGGSANRPAANQPAASQPAGDADSSEPDGGDPPSGSDGSSNQAGGQTSPADGSGQTASDRTEGSGDTANAPAAPAGASQPGSAPPDKPGDKPADARADPAGAAGGVAAIIPQPPTRDGTRPVDLLGGEDGGGDGQQGGGRQAGGQTANLGEPSGAGGAQAAPQLPVSDADAPAWKRYAQRMQPPQGVPKIAVIVRGLGLSSAAAETAVNQLPASVSLAFTPYARERAKAWAAEARRNGHEVLVDVPMEPADYPATDPGPQAIMTGITARENLQRLDWLLGQVDREVGAVAQMGSAVLANAEVAEPVLRDLKDRGLLFIDNGARADSVAGEIARRLGLPFALNDRTLDGGQVSRRAIEARLVEAERLAREQGLAVVMAHPYPVSLELLVAWTSKLEARGFVLVPATYAAIARAGQNAAQLR